MCHQFSNDTIIQNSTHKLINARYKEPLIGGNHLSWISRTDYPSDILCNKRNQNIPNRTWENCWKNDEDVAQKPKPFFIFRNGFAFFNNKNNTSCLLFSHACFSIVCCSFFATQISTVDQC
jgi:hypothetical protein